MDIKETLLAMDALDDDQWTGDGAPRVDFVEGELGSKVTRQDIIDVAPEFSRENMVISGEDPVTEEAGDSTEGGDPTSAEDEEVSMDSIEDYLSDDPMPEAEFVPYLMGVDKRALGVLEGVLIEQLQASEAAVSRATDLKNRVKVSLAYTRNRIKAEIPDVSNQEAIQAFIASQSAQRGERTEKTRELLKGVDLKSLDPRSAIDRAMARKTGRGGKRPTRGAM